jgi:hypothetical protein
MTFLTSLDRKFFQEICDKVISVNPAIRFAGIADEDGELLAFSERKGLIPLLTFRKDKLCFITLRKTDKSDNSYN